ncbi:hypothetical protein G6F56_009551 [Rhizopus delemar]|nr:hypothetical protein G6F56_009551 [Rhizopus delemar]
MKFDIRPEEKETDLLIDAIPPPIFSTRLVPVNYGYRQNLPVMRVKMKQPDGSYKIGLINRDRRSGLEITQVKFDAEKIPSESWQLLQVITDTIILQTIELVKKLFEERPIWTRLALKGQMDPKYHKYMKTALVHCAYTFVNGAWRDTWVKYGVDPRKSPEFYKYQIINVRRNTQPDSKNRRVRSQKSFVHRRKDVTDKERSPTRPHNRMQRLFKNGMFKQKSSTISIVPEKTLLEKVEAEKEKNKQEKEENTLLSAEKAVLEAQTEMATPETSKRLKDVVDEYIEEFERSANDHSRYLDAGDDSDFDIDDVFDEYDEDFDVFHENERNGTDNEDENQLEDMDIDDETINMDVDMNK